MSKYGFGRTPAKGTILRELLKATLRPEGVTIAELLAAGIKPSNLAGWVDKLNNEKGWDIRSFSISPEDSRFALHNSIGRKFVVYKCIGRMFWNCRYHSFVNPKAA